jgi:hypothetical protein
MRPIKDKLPHNLIIAAIILSVMLHLTALAALSGIAFFNIKELFSPRRFYAKIVSERPAHGLKSGELLKHASIPELPDAETNTEEFNDKTAEEEHPKETAKIEPPLESHRLENKPEDKHEHKIEEQQIASLSKSETPEKKNENTIRLLKSAKEKLYFEIYWIGIYVGKAVLEAVNEEGNVKITSQVHSAPFISTFYTVEDYAESLVLNGMPSFFKIKQREGRKRGHKETFFDIGNQKVRHINHIKNTNDEHLLNTANVWDIMSGFYYLRTQKLSVGETVFINIFDSNKFYQAEVHVLRKEKITMSDEKEIDAVVVKPILKSEGLFQNKGDISVWLTDDEYKTPLRVETEVPIGRVIAELKSIETAKEK